MRNLSTYASGLGRLVPCTGSGWEELRVRVRVLRAVLAPAMGDSAGTGCDELGAAGACTG